ncbi:MAG: class I tRNA ligase family protein [Chromatiales bacterium]|nr:class I tRNA ligase family protein [Chromatiales bacterium]
MEYIQADIWVRFQRMQGHDGALRLRRRHARRADHARAPRSRGHHAAGSSIGRVMAEHTGADFAGFHVGFDNCHSTALRRRTARCAQDIYRKLQGGRPDRRARRSSSSTTRSRRMFLPDRYIKGECPKCGAKDQYGDSCEVCGAAYAPTDLKNPYSTLYRRRRRCCKASEHYFFRLSDPRCVAVPASAGRRSEAGCSPRSPTRCSEWLGDAGDKQARRLGHLARRALLRHSRSRTRRASTSTSGSTRRSATSARFKNHLRPQAGRRLRRRSCAGPRRPSRCHFIGKDIVYFHTLFWPAMLKFAGYRKVPTNVFAHGFLTVTGEKMSKSRGTVHHRRELPRARPQPRVAALLLSPPSSTAAMEDIDFNLDDFVARVNSDLVGKYVNIASRSARLHQQALRRPAAAPSPCRRIPLEHLQRMTRPT